MSMGVDMADGVIVDEEKEMWGLPWWRTVVFFVLALGTWYFCVSAPETAAGESSGVVMELPARVLSFLARPEAVSQAEKDILPKDTEFAKMLYFTQSPITGAMEDLVSCSIVLSGRDRRSIHRPQVCLAAQGWSFGNAKIVPVTLANGETLRTTRLSLSRKEKLPGGQTVERQALYYYWFVGKDVAIPDSKTRILLTAWDNVFRNVNHRWAYVSVMSPITDGMRFDGKDDVETEAMIKEFLYESVPQFQKTF
ncbi:MAG: exosortase-associated EpsI family protein [Verrucomicrobiota bacterium]